MKRFLLLVFCITSAFHSEAQVNWPLFQCGPAYPVPPIDNSLDTLTGVLHGGLILNGSELNAFYMDGDTAHFYALGTSSYQSSSAPVNPQTRGLFFFNNTLYDMDIFGITSTSTGAFYPYLLPESIHMFMAVKIIDNNVWIVAYDSTNHQHLMKFDGSLITTYSPGWTYPLEFNFSGSLIHWGNSILSQGSADFGDIALYQFDLTTNQFSTFDFASFPGWSMQDIIDYNTGGPKFFLTGDNKLLAAAFDLDYPNNFILHTQTFDGVSWSPMTTTLVPPPWNFGFYGVALHGTDDLALYDYENNTGRIHLLQRISNNYQLVGYVDVGTIALDTSQYSNVGKQLLLDEANNLYVFSNQALNDQIQCGGMYVKILHDPVPCATGIAYADLNYNSIFDAGDYTLEGRQVCAPSFCSTTDTNGNYIAAMNTGSNTIVPESIPNFIVNPLTHTVPNATTLVSDLDFAYQPGSTSIVDLEASEIFSSPPRIGFDVNQVLTVYNAGNMTSGDTLIYTFDSHYTFLFALPAPLSQSGNTVKWLTTNINPLLSETFGLSLQLSDTTIMGSLLISTAYITAAGDNNTINDAFTLYQTAVSAFDPNDKTASPTYFVPDGNRIQYTIRFQNTGNDTAFNIIVRDTLNANLDWNNFELMSSSHPVVVDRNIFNGALAFRFHNILLPDSNTNEPASHGYAVYSIRTKAPLSDGTQIFNTASIYFDFNAPVVTNTTVNVIGDNVGIVDVNHQGDLVVFPNPATQTLYLRYTGNVLPDEFLITDLSGHVLNTILTANFESVNVNNLVSGSYIIELRSNSKPLARSRFVIMK